MKYLQSTVFNAALFMLFIISALWAEVPKLYESRPYEPVVIRGGRLETFEGAPISELHLFAYDASTGAWRMMPFQIDERKMDFDPYKPGNESAKRHSYFFQDDGLLDLDDDTDELVFIVGDLGDKAPNNRWIDNEDSKQYDRLEIMAWDPLSPESKAYCYIFRSSTIGDERPRPYNFSYDSTTITASSNYYKVRMGSDDGLIKDIHILPPFGTGVDIFDTQKIRFTGAFDFGFGAIPVYPSSAANERDNLHLYSDHLRITKNPVVRMIREIRQTIKLGALVVDDVAFYVSAIFYPYSGMVSGGAKLDPESLKREFNTEDDLYVQIDQLRQSWDFSQFALGMKYYSPYNNGILVNGQPDQVNTTVDMPIQEWNLMAGDQGSFFSYVAFADTNWQAVTRYFYDNSAGGQGDGTSVIGGDTGDGQSYGDHGIVFVSLNADSVSLELGFTTYFLPANMTGEDGEKIAGWIKHPVLISTTALDYATGVADRVDEKIPASFQLEQNHPNPFNRATRIRFQLSQAEWIQISVFDMNGRKVKDLYNGFMNQGAHHINWDGSDREDSPVTSGVYFCRLKSERGSDFRKMLLIR